MYKKNFPLFFVAGFLFLSTCTLPGDFDLFEELGECDAPHFDSLGEDSYCSGFVDLQNRSDLPAATVSRTSFRLPFAVSSRDGYIATAALHSGNFSRNNFNCDRTVAVTLYQEEPFKVVGHGMIENCPVTLFNDEEISPNIADIEIIDGPARRVALALNEGGIAFLQLESASLSMTNLSEETMSSTFEINETEGASVLDIAYSDGELFVAAAGFGLCFIDIDEFLNTASENWLECISEVEGSDQPIIPISLYFSEEEDLLWISDAVRGLLVVDINDIYESDFWDISPIDVIEISGATSYMDGWKIYSAPATEESDTRVWVMAGSEDQFRLIEYSFDGENITETAFTELAPGIIPSLGVLNENTLVAASSEPIPRGPLTDGENEGSFEEVIELASTDSLLTLQIFDITPNENPQELFDNSIQITLPIAQDHETTAIRAAAFSENAIYYTDVDCLNKIPVLFDYDRLFDE